MTPHLAYARDRLQAFLAELEHVSEAEFPYVHSKGALEQLKRHFQLKLNRLESLNDQSDPDVVKQQCALALRALFQYLPLAGFILRSTNVRNAFEMFAPLLRLARDVLEPTSPKGKRQTKLVISSEWTYSPFVYREIPDLPGFILIGIPAPESANPLLFPISGHELGHSLWATHMLEDQFLPSVKRDVVTLMKERWDESKLAFPYLDRIGQEDLLTDMFAVQYWAQAATWCLSQAEETFCDFIGLLVFDCSFLHAFAYLLSPNAGSRSAKYPGMKRRVKHLLKAAETYGLNCPAAYEEIFQDDVPANLTDSDRHRVSVADEALERNLQDLIQAAAGIIRSANIVLSSESEVNRIYRGFKRVVPGEKCRSLSDILNAAWMASADTELWNEMPEVHRNKDRVLKELVLKNVEIFEIEQKLKE